MEKLPVKPSALDNGFKEKLDHWKEEISIRAEAVMEEIMDEVDDDMSGTMEFSEFANWAKRDARSTPLTPKHP